MVRFPIEIRFLSHETTFLICENKKTKEDRKTSYVIECVMIIEKSYRKKNLFYINVKLFIKLNFFQHFSFFKKRTARFHEFIIYRRLLNLRFILTFQFLIEKKFCIYFFIS